MSGILDDFKNAFAKRNNGLIQLIWLNVAVYVVMLIFLITATCGVSKDSDIWFENVLSFIHSVLTPAMGHISLFRPWTILTYSHSFHAVNRLFRLFVAKYVDALLVWGNYSRVFRKS